MAGEAAAKIAETAAAPAPADKIGRQADTGFVVQSNGIRLSFRGERIADKRRRCTKRSANLTSSLPISLTFVKISGDTLAVPRKSEFPPTPTPSSIVRISYRTLDGSASMSVPPIFAGEAKGRAIREQKVNGWVGGGGTRHQAELI